MTTDFEIDRQKTVPFHLKLVYRTGGFHRLDDYQSSSIPPHFHLNTWFDCTLRELCHHLLAKVPHLFPSPPIGTRLNFRLVFPDTKGPPTNSRGPGRYTSKWLGTVVLASGHPASSNDNYDTFSPHPSHANDDESGTLTGARKEIIDAGLFSTDPESTPEKSLQDVRFIIGDYLECAIIAPLPNGDTAPFREAPANAYNTNPTPVYSLSGAGGVRGSLRNGAGGGGGGGGNDFVHPSRAGRIESPAGWRSGHAGYGSSRDAAFGERENGFGGFGANGGGGGGGGGGFRGGPRGSGSFGYGRDDVPAGEWRRGERLPDGPTMRGSGSYGRGRGGRRW